MERKIVRSVVPSVSADIRGDLVAGEYLLKALLQGPEAKDGFTFFVDPSLLEEATRKPAEILRASGICDDADGLRVVSMSDAPKELASPLGVWFNPEGGLITSLRIRSEFAAQPYPIVTLQHGFSVRTLFYDRRV